MQLVWLVNSCMTQERHWQAVNRIIQYLKSSPGKGLLFKKEKNLSMKVYTDADYARSIVDRRSTTRYCMFLGGNLVTWRSNNHFQVHKLFPIATRLHKTKPSKSSASEWENSEIWFRDGEGRFAHPIPFPKTRKNQKIVIIVTTTTTSIQVPKSLPPISHHQFPPSIPEPIHHFPNTIIIMQELPLPPNAIPPCRFINPLPLPQTHPQPSLFSNPPYAYPK